MTPHSSPLTPHVSVIGAGYWGKNLVRNFHQLGVLKTICDQLSPKVMLDFDTFRALQFDPHQISLFRKFWKPADV